jgi:hypothetical protein
MRRHSPGRETGAPGQCEDAPGPNGNPPFIIEGMGICSILAGMSKAKIPATGEGYLGEIMVHRLTRALGVVESVTEAKAGWPPQLTLKVADGSLKKGKLSDFREPTASEREKIPTT